jgi:hypothetical protein
VALTAAVVYAYQNDTYGRSKRYFVRLRAALQSYADALAIGGEICATLLRDLQQFLHCDSDTVPPSLQQVAKLLQSQEFTAVASGTVAALYSGIATASVSSRPANGTTSAVAQNGEEALERQAHQQNPQGALDKVLDALLSDRGHSLVSVAVSMGAKNMVAAYVETTQHHQMLQQQRREQDGQEPAADATDKLFTFLSSPAGQQLTVMSIAAFASNGMRVYMDKSLDVNFYEDLFSSMSKPAHLEAVKQCVGVFARDVVAAYLQGGYNGNNTSNARENTQSNNDGAHEHPSLAGTQVSRGKHSSTAHKSFHHVDERPAPEALAATPSERRDALAALSLSSSMPAHLLRPDNGGGSVSAGSFANSPGGSSGVTSEARALPTVEAFEDESRVDAVVPHRKMMAQDDLDSDGLLHLSNNDIDSAKLQEKRKARRSSGGGNGQAGNAQWIAAVGKEWINVSKHPDGRKLVAATVGSATRGAFEGMSQVVANRSTVAWWFVVLMIGFLLAVFCQQLLVRLTMLA